jgi:hypothetical protein
MSVQVTYDPGFRKTAILTGPRCAVCNGPSQTESTSVLHPFPRLLCWKCAFTEYEDCVKADLKQT